MAISKDWPCCDCQLHGECNTCDGPPPCALKSVVENFHSLQQLKAEISALVMEFRELYDGDFSGEAVSLLLTKLHELSAVQ